jgi:hypothetical protein
VEGRAAEEHFVHEDAKGPPVDRAPVPARADDLGGDVLLDYKQKKNERNKINIQR